MNNKPLFAIIPEFEEQYNKYFEIGKEYLKDKKIAVTGLVRNNADKLENNIAELDSLRSFCKELCYFIYENDSIDDTPKILSFLSKKILNFHYKSEKLNLKAFTIKEIDLLKSNSRTEALAKHRNMCLQYLKKRYSSFDYVIVTDLDFSQYSLNGIINSFGWFKNHSDIKALAGSSFEVKQLKFLNQPTVWNYDCWAYRGTWWDDLQSKIGYYHHDPMLWFGLWQPPVGSSPIKVNSAFGGTTIYKSEYYFSSIYEGYDCEHVCFHKNLYNKHINFDLRINPAQIMLFT